jgi:hypothetical protein
MLGRGAPSRYQGPGNHLPQPSIGQPHLSQGWPGSCRPSRVSGWARRTSRHGMQISTVNSPSTSLKGPVKVPQKEQCGPTPAPPATQTGVRLTIAGVESRSAARFRRRQQPATPDQYPERPHSDDLTVGTERRRPMGRTGRARGPACCCRTKKRCRSSPCWPTCWRATTCAMRSARLGRCSATVWAPRPALLIPTRSTWPAFTGD